MKASVVDLRYRMNDILRAVDRNEEVTILYHGKVKGVIKPSLSPNLKNAGKRISDHPFFNMSPPKKTVAGMMADLRGGRYRAV